MCLPHTCVWVLAGVSHSDCFVCHTHNMCICGSVCMWHHTHPTCRLSYQSVDRDTASSLSATCERPFEGEMRAPHTPEGGRSRPQIPYSSTTHSPPRPPPRATQPYSVWWLMFHSIVQQSASLLPDCPEAGLRRLIGGGQLGTLLSLPPSPPSPLPLPAALGWPWGLGEGDIGEGLSVLPVSPRVLKLMTKSQRPAL